METGPVDHDQRLKVAIKTFCPELLQAFFPDWRRRLDALQPVWLDKEVFYHPPEGEKGLLDLVGRFPLRDPKPEGPTEHLFHIEVESDDSAARVRPRMHPYWDHIGKTHKLPVASVALYLNVAFKGRGRDSYQNVVPGGNRFHFEWRYVGLPGLDPKRYIRSRNLFAAALSALMRPAEEDKAGHTAELLEKIARSPESDYRKFLLTDIVRTYLILNEEQTAEFRLLMSAPEYQRAQTMALTFFEEGQLAKTQRIVLKYIDKQFGLSEPLRRLIEAMTEEQLDRVIDKMMDSTKSLDDLGLAGADGPYARNGTAR